MKKNSVFVGVLVVLLFVALSGCQEENNENINNITNNSNGNQQDNITDNKFLGIWEVVDLSDYETYSFHGNGSVKNYQIQKIEGQSFTTISWFDYTIENTSICFSTKDKSPDSPDYFSICFSYLFSENATHLALYYNGIVIMDLIKMPVE